MGKRWERFCSRFPFSALIFLGAVAPSSPTNGLPHQFFFRLSSNPRRNDDCFPPIPEEPHVYTRRHCSPREMCSFLATFFKRRLACYLESRSRPGSHLFSHLGNYPRCLSLRKTEHRGFQPPLNGIVMRDSMPRYRISALFSKKRLKEVRLEGGY